MPVFLEVLPWAVSPVFSCCPFLLENPSTVTVYELSPKSLGLTFSFSQPWPFLFSLNIQSQGFVDFCILKILFSIATASLLFRTASSVSYAPAKASPLILRLWSWIPLVCSPHTLSREAFQNHTPARHSWRDWKKPSWLGPCSLK